MKRGTREACVAVLDAHGVGHALLVQPSCYGFDNSAMLDAMAAAPGRFKAHRRDRSGDDPSQELQDLADRGVVGVRFNLVNFDRAAAPAPAWRACWSASRALAWFAQVYARDEQWQAAGPLLRQSGVKILVDHFGIGDLAAGPRRARLPGRARARAQRPRRRQALRPLPHRRLARSLSASSTGMSRPCWRPSARRAASGARTGPSSAIGRGIRYGDALAALDRWLPDAADRERVLRRNPARLFGFGSDAMTSDSAGLRPRRPPLRIGLAGAGMISHHHLVAWSRDPRAEVVAICDPDLGAGAAPRRRNSASPPSTATSTSHARPA